MLCKIADLITEVPDTGGLAPRVRDYLWDGNDVPDIIIRESDFRPEAWKGAPYDLYCYMETGAYFHSSLLNYGGIILHASAVIYDGRAYLFSGPSGIGKSTHTRLWKQFLGDEAIVINDDKPALRFLDERWYAYGTPWCGKEGINVNVKRPLAGICFLEQGEKNSISELSAREAIPQIIPQTMYKFKRSKKTYLLLKNINCLMERIPMFHMVNRADLECAQMSFDHMSRCANERGL
jgi:hypothetical protein